MGRKAMFNREEAVEHAMNQIWKYGYEACSVKALSEELGITRSSFYNAFESREALFKEVLTLYSAQAPDHVLLEVTGDTPVLPRLTSFFRRICRDRATDSETKGCLATNCVADLVGVHDELGPMLEDVVQGSVDRFERLLVQALGNGELLDEGDLRAKALALQNLVLGLCVMGKVIRNEKDLWATARLTLDGLGLLDVDQ